MKKLMCLMIGILISIGWIGYGYTAELFLKAGVNYSNVFNNQALQDSYVSGSTTFRDGKDWGDFCSQHGYSGYAGNYIILNGIAFFHYYVGCNEYSNPDICTGEYRIEVYLPSNAPQNWPDGDPNWGYTKSAIDQDGDGIPDEYDLDFIDTIDKNIGTDKNNRKINCDQNFVADPINIFNGNLLEKETDFVFNSPFEGGLVFKRYYNSQSASDSTIGFGWTHNY
ncbi:MAG: hypothetical protein KAQ72_17480, partial [Desulfobacula sp.]|nr:hypothetical protein [Desulfobacula sp.]